MKTKAKIKQLVTALSLVIGLSVMGQENFPKGTNVDYTNAIGFRFGGTSGVTFKHQFGGGNAFEGIISAWPYQLGLTGLYEKHFSAGAPGLNCYFGAGAHANFGGPSRVVYYRYYDDRRYRYAYTYHDGYAFGLDAIGGIEYKFRPIPFAISADIKPTMEMNDYGNVYMYFDPSIGLKFAF